MNNIAPITDFQPERYLGKWYEIARLPNRFQKDLIDCTTEYSRLSESKIRVINSGYHVHKKERSSASGTAKFLESDTTGLLKVSFFWPFSGLYKIIEIGPEYDFTVVVSSGYDYLWVLARTPEMREEQLTGILERARNSGFDVKNIIINPRQEKKPVGPD